ncbi:MAG: branched-chain amino acid ABC transporter permease [Firmicutes bacterium]|nr:branched-chain amino acid ABC transporter permease [Bacillota bacterium]
MSPRGEAWTDRLTAFLGRPEGRWAALALAVVAALVPLALHNQFETDILTDMALWAAIALGLNVVIGFAGLLDLGYMAFYAFGGYAFGILSTQAHWTFWECLPVGALLAAAFGGFFGFPTLRLRGDYLAVMTLGFGEIVYLAANNLQITGGPGGIFGMPLPAAFGVQLGSPVDYYWMALALVVLAAWVIGAVARSRTGRAWAYLREDETAAQAMGIPVTRYKLLAYVFGAMWAGIAGAIFAAKQTIVTPDTFTFQQSFLAVAVVVLGGMGSLPGVVLGGVVYILIDEYFQAYTASYSGLIFAALLLLFILLRPGGIWPSRLRLSEVAGAPARARSAPGGTGDVAAAEDPTP